MILDATSTNQNIRFGTRPTIEPTTGVYNTAIGYEALKSVTAGNYNTAIGYQSQFSITDASYNTSIGSTSLYRATGQHNTAIGGGAGYNVTSGIKNTCVGFQSDVTDSYNKGTALGYESKIRADHHIAIGTQSESATICSDSAPSTGYKLTVGGAVQATSYNATSDRRLKSNIQILSNQSKTILDVIPVTFDWKVDGKHDVGFIAQDVYKSYPELLPKHMTDPSINVDEPIDTSGNPIYHAMDYGRMTPFLWQGMREIILRLDALEDENRELKSRIEILESK